jgi:glycosyltransferase involved in cell wall biosynthesis
VAANPNLYFYFIGDGDLRPMVAEKLADSRTASHVHFTGLLGPDAIPDHLAACDILLSPHLPFEDGSVFFGSPTKLFEYMASGRAIVASRLGQIARVVIPGVTGRLHDPGDGRQFQEAVLALAADPEERRHLGREARRTAEDRYTWKENVRRALNGIVSFPEGQTD